MVQHISEIRVQPRPFAAAAEIGPPQALAPACEDMMARALDFTEQKTHIRGRSAIAEALGKGQHGAQDYFLYGLAKQVGRCLGEAQPTVKAVYFFEPEAQGEEAGEANLPSLALDHADYKGHHGSDRRTRDAVYDQDTVCGWLIGPFFSAHQRMNRDPALAR